VGIRKSINPGPQREATTRRQVDAACRVLSMSVRLASLLVAIVVVGGWVPDIPFPGADSAGERPSPEAGILLPKLRNDSVITV
jgi:hypothetical protein